MMITGDEITGPERTRQPIVGVAGVGVVGQRLSRMIAADYRVALYDQRPIAPGHRARLRSPSVVVKRIADLVACDVVVVATPSPHAGIAAELIGAGTSVVSVGDEPDDVDELLALDDLARDRGATLVIGAAMSPGLSGLLARTLADQLTITDEVHVAAHGTAGPSCARQHHRALAGRAMAWHDGEWIDRPAGSGRELCWFPEPVGAYDCYRADMVDPMLLHRVFPDLERVTARLSATRRDRLTARLPMLRPPHREGGVSALRVEARGAGPGGERVTLVVGIAELAGPVTAALAAAFAGLVVEGALAPGVAICGDAMLPTYELLRRVAAAGVRLQEFTGIPN